MVSVRKHWKLRYVAVPQHKLGIEVVDGREAAVFGRPLSAGGGRWVPAPPTPLPGGEGRFVLAAERRDITFEVGR